MSYRKIVVSGVIHEYVIGKSHTKIKHVGTFRNDQIGVVGKYDCLNNENIYSVTPEIVKQIIENARVAELVKAPARGG